MCRFVASNTASAREGTVRSCMSVRDRLRSILDERRYRDYARGSTAIFCRLQPISGGAV